MLFLLSILGRYDIPWSVAATYNTPRTQKIKTKKMKGKNNISRKIEQKAKYCQEEGERVDGKNRKEPRRTLLKIKQKFQTTSSSSQKKMKKKYVELTLL